MAEVFLAEQVGVEGFRKRVVIKRLLPKFARQRPVVEMFLNEARLASFIDHPNVIQILDLGQDEQDFFIAMEFLDCRTFADIEERARQRGQRIPIEIAVRILADACAGLAWAHDAVDGDGRPIALIHRDFTPANIAVTFDGRVKILDFGIAKSTVVTSDTEPGDLKGKYAYMSPEMVAGQPFDRRIDLFAAGVMLYEMTTGQLPFKGSTLPELLASISAAEPTPPRALVPTIPEPLEALTLQLLRRDPADRPQSALDVKKALDRVIATHAEVVGPVELAKYLRELFPETQGVKGAPTPPPLAQAERPAAPARSWFKLGALVGSAVAVVAVATTVALWKSNTTVPSQPSPIVAQPTPDAPVALGEGPNLVGPGIPLPPLPERPKAAKPHAIVPPDDHATTLASSTNPLLTRLYALRAEMVDGGMAPRTTDGGVPTTVEIGGLQIPIAVNQTTLGHRPVQGAVDEAPSTARADKPATPTYDDYLEERKAGLSSCASWSPDGREVKGWLSVEWLVSADGIPSHFKVLDDGLNAPVVERCMLREMATWRFTPPPHEALTVRHNFYLTMAGRSELPAEASGSGAEQ